MLLQLHDNGEESFNVFPPIKWNEFQPKGKQAILDHYYAYSAGCKTPTLWGGLALASVGVASAAFAPAIAAGLGKTLGGIKAGSLIGSVKDKEGEAQSLVTDATRKSLEKSANTASNTARQKTRRRLDSNSEKQRIAEAYARWYARSESNNFSQRVSQMNLDQLKAELAKQKAIVKDAEKKCSKVPCDTAGCRAMGPLTLRMQYVQALIKAYQSTGTKTPAEFNQKFSDAVAKGKTSMSGFSIGLPFLIILGAAFSLLRKKK